VSDDGPICYGYGRHSTHKQEFTRKAQRLKTKQYWWRNLRKKGIRWGGFYYDKAISGKRPFSERPAGREVYALLRPGDYLISSRLDRPFRSVADGVTVIQTLTARSVAFISLDLQVDTSTPMGKFFTTVLLAVAELERAFTSERVLEVNAARRKAGLPVGHVCPMGWKIIGQSQKKSKSGRSTRRYTIDYDERNLCMEIHRRRSDNTPREKIILWLYTQTTYPAKRLMLDRRLIDWAVAASCLGFPLEVDREQVMLQYAKKIDAIAN
jgi:DNA invertase Pin-like site-specific DNA recombinase